MKIFPTLFTLCLTLSVYAQTPQIVKDVYPGATSGAAFYSLVKVNDKVLFRGTTATEGTEIWVSDGTLAGTHMIKDIVPGNLSSMFSAPFYFNGKYYFTTNDANLNYELYVSDLTASGTNLFKDFAGIQSSTPNFLFALSNSFFGSYIDANLDRLLYISDGTSINTLPVTPSVYCHFSQKVVVGSKAYFSASSSSVIGTEELWMTDGTMAGTVLLKDIFPGATGSSPSYLTQLNSSQFLFSASDGINGTELWISDGTAPGTMMLKDIAPGMDSSNPGNFVLWNNKAYFAASDGINGMELWVTDGTGNGTYMLKDIDPTASSFPSGFTACNGSLFFSASDAVHGRELWKTDGTTNGTGLVKDLCPLFIAGLEDDRLLSLNNNIYFAGNDGIHGRELCVSDGTAAGTHIVHDLDPVAGGMASTAVYNINGNVLFLGNDGTTGVELYSLQTPATIRSIETTNSLSLYPNPAAENITISGYLHNASIRVTNIFGQLVYEANNIEEFNHMLDVSTLATGTYIVDVTSGHEKSKIKLIKQ